MNNENFSIFEEFKKGEERKKERRKKIVFFLFFFLIFIFSFSFKFFKEYFRLSPETILSNSFQSMLSANSFRGKGDFSFEFLEKEDLYMTKIETDSFYDRREKEKIKTLFKASLFLKKPNFEIEYSLAGQCLKYDNLLYFIFSEISPSLELFFRIFSVNISKWKSEWIRTNTDNDFLLNFIDFSQKKNLFRVKEQLPDVFFEGKKVYHLLVVLNKEELFNFLSQFLKNENFSFKDLSEKIGDLEFEFFIDKKNFRIYRIISKKNLEISKNALPDSWKVSFSADLQFFDFEKSNEVFLPSIFKEFSEFYQEFSKIFQSPLFYFLKNE